MRRLIKPQAMAPSGQGVRDCTSSNGLQRLIRRHVVAVPYDAGRLHRSAHEGRVTSFELNSRRGLMYATSVFVVMHALGQMHTRASFASGRCCARVRGLCGGFVAVMLVCRARLMVA